MEKMFETALRNKYRFPYKGMISAEDLWDLKVEQLDSIFKCLNAKARLAQEESLLLAKKQEDVETEHKIEIVRYVVSVKLAEAEKAKLAAQNRMEAQKIMGIIARKQDDALLNLSMEELQAKLAALQE